MHFNAIMQNYTITETNKLIKNHSSYDFIISMQNYNIYTSRRISRKQKLHVLL